VKIILELIVQYFRSVVEHKHMFLGNQMLDGGAHRHSELLGSKA
jgi:hypothetical protein